MARSQPKQILRSAGYAVVMAVGLSIVSVTGAVGSPEDEIARLNRVRGNLFEELVKTRAEAAIARSELDAARKARDAAEAEVIRLKQEAASAKPANPVPSAATSAQPQQNATTTASPAAPRESVRPVAPAATGSAQRTAKSAAQQRIVRTNQASRQSAAPVARVRELPSVLRLLDPR
jgi:hypothetical protein